MRKLQLYIISILLSGVPALLYSAQIDESAALEKAKQFYAQKATSRLRSTPDFQLIYTCKDTTSLLKSANATVYYYIFNLNSENQSGFVIVSGDDATKPILGYSNECAFSVDNIPANLRDWLNLYKSEIKCALDAGLSSSTLGSIDAAEATSLRSAGYVEPLLGNIKWDQGSPYNLLCPFDKTANKYTLTGCVATAMAQIMKYDKWPAIGKGMGKDTTDTYGVLTTDFSKTTYDWNNMLGSYNTSSTGQQDTAVATLIYHCGVSVDMDYGISESHAYFQDAASALINNFGYDANIQQYTREFFTASEWDNLIKTELNAARPVLYSGSTGNSNHTFICDGYDSNDFFHMNWGWGGKSNGYFELSALTSSTSGIDETISGFNKDQAILAGIKRPDGISNVNYQLALYSDGLNSSASSVSVRNNTVTLSYGLLNYGINSFSGKIGIGIFKNGVFQAALNQTNSISALQTFYGYFGDNKASFNVSLNTLTPGTPYQLYAIYMPADSSSWSIIRGSNLLNNYLNVVVDNGTATITNPLNKPVLALNQTLSISGKAYHNRTAKFDLSVKNTGSEFYSNLGIYIYSTSDSSIHQYVNYGVVCIPAGATSTFTISGNITCEAGSYYAVAVYDTTNSYATNSFRQIEPTDYNPISVNILEEPSTPILQLNNKISLSDGIAYRNGTITLNASITNTGGYFDSQLIAFIFPLAGGTSLDYLDPRTFYIDQNETKTISLTGSLSLDPGTYLIGLYSSDSSSWNRISPKDSSLIRFTLADQIIQNVPDTNSVNFEIYPNPVKDVLHIQTSSTIRQIQIFDLSGRILIKETNNSAPNVISLQSGVYLLRVETDNGIKTERFIKE